MKTILALLLSLSFAHPLYSKDAQSTKARITLAKGGVIVIKLYPNVAPLTVANFVKLAKKGFYNGLSFHRVVPGFVVQGGDPAGDGSGGPGYTIKGEFTTELRHVKGTVSMARRDDPDSAGCQFFICLASVPNLDGKYAIFGQVTKGLDLIDQIKIGDKMSKVEILP